MNGGGLLRLATRLLVGVVAAFLLLLARAAHRNKAIVVVDFGRFVAGRIESWRGTTHVLQRGKG